jgi:uncharacterized membrane protein YqjE
MNPQELPGGIPSRITGLLAGLLRHLLSLGGLAAEEARILVRRSLATLLIGVAMIMAAMIAYVAAVAAIVVLLAQKFSWGWPLSLVAAALFHLALLGILFRILRNRTAPPPFEATASELRKDLEALTAQARNIP